MAHSQKRASVRTRQRVARVGTSERLVADPVDPTRKKRQPNAGSMKKGETRNPNGRPRGAKGTKAMVRKVLLEKTTIREGGRSRRVTIYNALLLKEVQMAFAGDWRARKTVLELGRWALPEEVQLAAPLSPEGTSATDAAILAWFEQELLGSKEVDDAKPQ